MWQCPRPPSEGSSRGEAQGVAFKTPSLYETCPRSAEPRPLTGFATAHRDAGGQRRRAARPASSRSCCLLCVSPSSPLLLHHVIYVEKKKRAPSQPLRHPGLSTFFLCPLRVPSVHPPCVCKRFAASVWEAPPPDPCMVGSLPVRSQLRCHLFREAALCCRQSGAT